MGYLLLAVPVAIVASMLHAKPVVLFIAAGVAIIPLAGVMGQATEQLAHRLGSGIGGLLNATFGNAAEFIIGILALKAGLLDVVKASITGSIIVIGLILGQAAVEMFSGG